MKQSRPLVWISLLMLVMFILLGVYAWLTVDTLYVPTWLINVVALGIGLLLAVLMYAALHRKRPTDKPLYTRDITHKGTIVTGVKTVVGVSDSTPLSDEDRLKPFEKFLEDK